MALIVSLPEAIAGAVHDGDTVAMEGFTHLIPHAAGREVIRQGRRELTLVRMTPDVIYDQMIGAGCARKLVFSWGGNPGVGWPRSWRRTRPSWPCCATCGTPGPRQGERRRDRRNWPGPDLLPAPARGRESAARLAALPLHAAAGAQAATRYGPGALGFDIRLQGEGETVFFDV